MSLDRQSGLPPHFMLQQQALATLASTHRRVLALRFLQHHATAEIAVRLGCSVASVMVLQHQALLGFQRITAKIGTVEPACRLQAA